MSNKAIVITIVILILLIILVFAVFINLKSDTNDGHSQRYYDEQRDKKIQDIENGVVTGRYSSKLYNFQYLNLTNEERASIDKKIDYVYNLITSRDIDKLYDALSEIYKKSKFPIKNAFRDYFENTYYSNKGLEVTDYTLIEDAVCINMKYKADNTDAVKCTISNYLDDEIKIYFDNYHSSKNASFSFVSSDLKLDCESIIYYDDRNSAVFSIYKPLKIDFTGTEFVEQRNRNTTNYKTIGDTNVEIDPGANKYFELDFEKIVSNVSTIKLKMVVNGKEYTKDFELMYGEDD